MQGAETLLVRRLVDADLRTTFRLYLLDNSAVPPDQPALKQGLFYYSGRNKGNSITSLIV